MSFAFTLVRIFTQCLVFFFFSKLFEGACTDPRSWRRMARSPLGIAFYPFLGVGLQSLADSISRAQMTGTLEALLVTPTSLTTVIFSSSLFAFLFAAARVVVYLVIGTLVFSVGFGQANLGVALLVLVLSTVAFAAIGMISASFVMIFKRSSPTDWIFGGISTILGGVLFPVDVLPAWLRPVSLLLPMTHALEAMRLAMLKGAGLSELWPQLAALSAFAPSSCRRRPRIPLRRALGQKTGSLVQY